MNWPKKPDAHACAKGAEACGRSRLSQVGRSHMHHKSASTSSSATLPSGRDFLWFCLLSDIFTHAGSGSNILLMLLLLFLTLTAPKNQNKILVADLCLTTDMCENRKNNTECPGIKLHV